MRRLLVWGVVGLCLVPPAHGQVSFQLQSTQCLDRGLPFQQEFTLQIVAQNTNGSSFERLEFRVTGFSLDDFVLPVQVAPNPEVTSAEGNPFEEGAIITFPACQESTEPILLYTATLFPLSPNYTPQIEIQGIDAPSDPGFPCPTATSCDAAPTCLSSWVWKRQILVPPYAPYPPDEATGVSPNVQLAAYFGEACHCLGLPCIGLDFGIDPDPPGFGGGCDIPFPQPGPLEPFTTYYWRVSMSICGEFARSPVWSFTTGSPIALHPVHWGQIKALYR